MQNKNNTEKKKELIEQSINKKCTGIDLGLNLHMKTAANRTIFNHALVLRLKGRLNKVRTWNGNGRIRKNIKGQRKAINKIEQLPEISTSIEEVFNSYEYDNDSTADN